MAGLRTAGPSRSWLGLCTVRYACRDLVHEWRVSVCLVLALAAVLTPLLILFGLKSGIVTTLTERLKRDPRNLEIKWSHNAPLDPDWIETLRARPDVGFLVPNTRSLAATMDLSGETGSTLSGLDMIPTASGDPLFAPGAAIPDGLGEVVLSHEAGQALAATVGMPLHGEVRRRYLGQDQNLRIPLHVVGILSEASYGGQAAFVSLALLIATEEYRDSHRVPGLGVTEGRDAPRNQRRYARVRLYARSLDRVAGLADRLRAEGFEVTTRAKEIELVRNIDRTLSFLFRIIAGVGVTGFILSLATSLWANVDRKRRDLAVLRLVGLSNGALTLFPVSQAVLVASAGLLLSGVSYALVSWLIDQSFAVHLGREEFVCRLLVRDGLIAAISTEVLAVTASLMGGYSAAQIDPAEDLRLP